MFPLFKIWPILPTALLTPPPPSISSSFPSLYIVCMYAQTGVHLEKKRFYEKKQVISNWL